MLDALARPVRASNRSVRRNYKGPGGAETWDDEGEPGNRGHLLPVNRLYERVNAGELVVSEPHGPQLIASLAASQHPIIDSPWACPSRDACVNAPNHPPMTSPRRTPALSPPPSRVTPVDSISEPSARDRARSRSPRRGAIRGCGTALPPPRPTRARLPGSDANAARGRG